MTDTITAREAAAAIATLHADTLAIEGDTITAERASRVDAALSKLGAQTTTELLLLLARFHADNDDEPGSEMLAEFAVRFAELESTVV